jgi:hypothetical protein
LNRHGENSPPDFKSDASTDSATPANPVILPYKINLSRPLFRPSAPLSSFLLFRTQFEEALLLYL